MGADMGADMGRRDAQIDEIRGPEAAGSASNYNLSSHGYEITSGEVSFR